MRQPQQDQVDVAAAVAAAAVDGADCNFVGKKSW